MEVHQKINDHGISPRDTLVRNSQTFRTVLGTGWDGSPVSNAFANRPAIRKIPAGVNIPAGMRKAGQILGPENPSFYSSLYPSKTAKTGEAHGTL